MALNWLCGPLQASCGLLEGGYLGSSFPKSAGNCFLGSRVGCPENSSGNQAEKSLGGGGSCLASPPRSPQSPQRSWERGLTLGTCLTVGKGNGGGNSKRFQAQGVPCLPARDAAVPGGVLLHALRPGCLWMAHLPHEEAHVWTLPPGQILLVSAHPHPFFPAWLSHI